ncbi:hypothetical protein GFL49_29890 [Rhizobium leguminosarum bv. viciae]|nr:hypothetical protein [Rhizobium leguminosarum bv. viciae]NKL37898.1 hypothetical protein [Rhizobium leguminosarum bv. viciae]
MFQEDDKLGKSPANLFIQRGQNAHRRAGSMPVTARPADKVALCIQGVHDDGDSYPTMRDG